MNHSYRVVCDHDKENLVPITKPKQQETITWDEYCFDRDGKYLGGVAA